MELEEAIKIVNSLKEWGKIHFFVKDRSYARLTYNEVYLLLNLIEKQQKSIEHWKAGMKLVERDKNNHIERLEKELEELKDNNVLIKRYFNKCDLIKHLDNVINEMSEYMDDNIHYNRKTSCLKCGKKYRTQETIRKYFEKKVEG